MRADIAIRSAVIFASLMLIPWMLAPSANAVDQLAGPGTTSQKEEIKKEEIKKEEIKKDTTEGRSPSLQDPTAAGELKKEAERPMKVPEGVGSQEFDRAMLEQMRIQDERSALSF